MSDSSTADDHDHERKAKLEEFYFQRRVLAGCTLSLLLGVLLWITAMSTNRWYIVNGNKGLFVEGTRRYFKYSETGIWRTCRKMYTPVPTAHFVVRNFTTLAYKTPSSTLKAKEEFRGKDFVQEFLKVELPELDTIDEIDESFRQQLFAQWVSYNDKASPRFTELKDKLKTFLRKYPNTVREFVDPADLKSDEVKDKIGNFVTVVNFNDTHTVTFVIPDNLRLALFNGWEEQGLSFVQLLNAYGKNLGIDPNLYKNGMKYIFQPSLSNRKKYNGFIFNKITQCTFTNLFAHTDAEVIASDPSMDEHLLELSRTAATFTIFTIFLIILGFVFTVYTFFNPRYMFKRLAGGVHFISGVTSLIVCKSMLDMYYHSQEHLKSKFPAESKFEPGFGLFFGIFTSAINFISSILFIWYSKKKKGNKAATEELGMADEPIQIGR